MQMTIELKGLRIYAHHGVMEQERKVGNTFEVTASLTYPVACDAEISDNLDGTINYAEVAEIIRREMAAPSQLLEHVAARIRHALIGAFPQVTSGKITVAKLTPPLGASLQCASATLAW